LVSFPLSLLVGDSEGTVSSWSVADRSCNMSWQAENSEVTMIQATGTRMITGSASHVLKRWLCSGDGQLELEDDLRLDGAVVAAAFDASQRLGVAATTGGTLWYLDWPLRTTIRLQAGHADTVG
jgi:hypothetical protein